jgi:hypothetical protein
VLPVQFSGGHRYNHQRFLDCMSLVDSVGNPTLFITFTANPQRKEIKDSIGKAHPNYRLDIVARVFRIKLDAMLE